VVQVLNWRNSSRRVLPDRRFYADGVFDDLDPENLALLLERVITNLEKRMGRYRRASRTCTEEQHDMKTESVRYDADGLQMVGHFAYDENDSKKRPGVLVLPEAFGLGDHAKKRAERIAAELGYAAMACDLHGEQKIIGELDQVMALLQPLRTDERMSSEVA
jgi:hypothetical protein